MENNLQNSNPQFLTDFFHNVSNFLTDFGWYVLLIFFVLLYIFYKIQPHIEMYFKRKAEEEYSAKYHKDPDLFQSRLVAIEEARKRMQHNQDEMTREHTVKQKQREELKRQEWLNKQTIDCGSRLGGRETDDNSKKSLKPEYNPLMGGSTSGGSSYRAPRRSPCNGGCGK